MSTHVHVLRRVLAAGAMVLAVLAAIVGAPATPSHVAASPISTAEHTRAFPARKLHAIQLAAWIREGSRDLRVLDLRGDSAYRLRHVPSAEAADFALLDTLARHDDATVVLYSADDVRDAQAWASLAARGHKRAYVLDGGMDAWLDEVMEPVLRSDSADYIAALSRYFGGSPRPAPAEVPDEFGEAGRRGC
jgi:rhodanese-related sulfurtransferase